MVSEPDLRQADLATVLRLARGGSRAATELLFEQCREYLLFIANRELTDAHRTKMGASDLVQVSMIKANENLASFQGFTTGELLTWLRQILIRTLLDSRRYYLDNDGRALRKEVPVSKGRDIADSMDTPSVQLMLVERDTSIERALQQLPADYRQVVYQRIWESKSFVAIAEGMGRSPDAVRKLWFRGVERLRQLVEFADDHA